MSIHILSTFYFLTPDGVSFSFFVLVDSDFSILLSNQSIFLLDTEQCEQIWQNFTTFEKSPKSLAICWGYI